MSIWTVQVGFGVSISGFGVDIRAGGFAFVGKGMFQGAITTT